MPPWRQLLLYSYYYGSYPWRAARNARARAAGRSPVIVLFYHRIADRQPNPRTMPNRTFARQIGWLKRHFDMVSLTEAQLRIRCEFNDRLSVAVTFDDGYSDNCREALPLLVAEQVPCTYFVTTHNVVTGAPFVHDGEQGQPLVPNTIDELRQLVRAGIELGAHTRTHPDLGRISDPERLHDEVVTAGGEIEQLTGARVRYFSFPYGQHVNLNPDVFHLARQAGYEGVCSAYGGFNFPGDDAFHLQRIHADNDMIRLKNWISVDPRKLGLVRRYEYESRCPACAQDVGVRA